MKLVHMDYLTIETGKANNNVNILVVTDHSTRYAQAFITLTQTARVVAQTLCNKFFMHNSLPEKMLSYHGRNFESSLISALCKVSKIKKLRTMPYRPQTNGQFEWFNATLISMLGTLPNDAKTKWQDHISTCTCSNAMGFSLYFLMYGKHLMLPINIELGSSNPKYFSINHLIICAKTAKQASIGL